MRALLGNLGEGSYAGGLCVEEGSGMGLPPYRGPVGGPGGGGIYQELQELREGGLWLWSISLCGSYVTGDWRGGSFAGDTVGYERKALEMGNSLHGVSVGQPGVASPTRDFDRWLKVGSGGGESLSMGAL